MNKPIFIVALNLASAEKEAEFNDWYNNIHVPFLLEIPGIISAARYQAVVSEPGQAKYLAIYEFDNVLAIEPSLKSPQIAEATEDLFKNWGSHLGEVKGISLAYQPIGLSAGQKPLLTLAANIAKLENEFAFNSWYEQKHLPEMLAVPGVESGARYHVLVAQEPEQAKYLTLYELESLDHVEAVLASPEFAAAKSDYLTKIQEGTVTVADSLGIAYIDFGN
jgi:conserved hypothetical protein